MNDAIPACESAATTTRLGEKGSVGTRSAIVAELQLDAEIAAVGSGNPMSFEPFQANQRKLFHGKAMSILRTIEDKPGTIHVRATSSGISDGEAQIASATDETS